MKTIDVKNVTVDDFSNTNNFTTQINFVYDGKNYNCKCEKLDKFTFNVYDENKNVVLCANCDVNGENVVVGEGRGFGDNHEVKLILLSLISEIINNINYKNQEKE